MLEELKIKKVKQTFNGEKIIDLKKYIKKAVADSDLSERLKPGQKIGITVGSRGINNIAGIVKALVDELKELNVEPFILPAMGSHGGATAAGQEEVLDSYGVNQKTMGVPIKSSMETVKIGEIGDGLPVYFSKAALEADGIIALNRVKAHTDFTGEIESGVSKVMVIGLGKARGAESIHSRGVNGLKMIPEAASLIIKKAPIIQGVAILENGYDKTMKINFSSPEKILETDKKVLVESKQIMPGLPLNNIDVVIVMEMGKNISGAGLDTNVIGRLYINGEEEYANPNIIRLVVLDLTDESHGNAVGLGLCDITTQKLIDKIDKQAMYTNGITSTFLQRGKFPVALDSDREAIKVALKTCWQSLDKLKLVIIKNTLNLENIYVSKQVWSEIKDSNQITSGDDWELLSFDQKDDLVLDF